MKQSLKAALAFALARKFATVVTTLALSIAGLGISPAQASVPVDGDYSCATGVRNGPSPHYIISQGEVTWGDYCEGAVVIAPGATRIGQLAFGYAQITSITIPESVTTILDNAFHSSTLTSVTIPASVTSIGLEAFINNMSLTSVTFPPGSQLQSISEGTFGGATSLTSISIPASVKTIGSKAFRGSNLNTVTFDSGSQLTSIGFQAFSNTKISSITLPASIESLGTGAFQNSAISLIRFLGTTAPTLGSNVFANTSAPSIVVAIEPGVTAFGAIGSFWNGLRVVDYATLQSMPTNGSYSCATGEIDGPTPRYTISNGSVVSGQSCTGSVLIPSGVESIGYQAFEGSGLTSITIPASVTTLSPNSLRSNNSLALVRFLGTTPPTVGANAFVLASNAVAAIEPGVTAFGAIGSFWNGLTVLDYSTLQSLPANGSYSCETGLQDGAGNKYQITSGVLTGGGSCNGAVVVAAGTVGIGTNAFNGSAMTSINIPASVTSILDRAFFDTNSLTAFAVAGDNPNFSSIAGVLFNKNATTLIQYPVKNIATSYAIPSGVTSIGNHAFRKARLLTSVTIPARVKSIGEDAFSEASTLASVTLPEGLTSIGPGAFGQTAITSINIPAGITSISNYTFAFARQLTSIIIPASVESIGEGAFQDNIRLHTVRFEPGSQLQTIGTNAFFSAAALTKIGIPASVTSIGTSAFQNARLLADVGIFANVAPTVGANAFHELASLARVHIKAGATGFGSSDTWNGLRISVGLYEVSFDSKGGSAVATVVDFGSITEPAAPTRPGYTFEGWSATDGGTAVSFPYALSQNVSLYALWSRQFVINFESNGGSAVEDGSFKEFGSLSAAPTAPTRRGYTFAGWSATDGGTAVAFPYAPGVSEDITLYAFWDANTHSVNLILNGGSNVPAVSFKTDAAITSAPTAPTRRGYTFAGWSATNGGTAVAFPYAPGVSEDINLYALWTVTNYSVTYNANGGVAVPNGSFTVERDLALVTPIRVGYTFNGWSATDGGSLISFPYAPGVVENITLYANWTRNPYKPELLANATVSGTGFQSTNMKATFGSWSAYPAAVLSVQWYRCDKAVSAGLSSLAASAKCVVIPKATKTTYKVVVADELKYLTVLVQAENSIGITFTTAKSFRALALKAPTKGKLPDVDGSAIAKKPLTADIGTWTSNPIAKTSIQWFRCEEPTKLSSLPVAESSECTAIKGATKSKYTLSKADEGKYVTAQIKAENTEGIAFTTAKSSRVALTPSSVNAPAISGSAQLNKTLTAGAGSWEAYPAAKTSFKWYRCNKPTTAGAEMFGGSSGCAAIKGATKNRYTVTASDRGKYISALITAENVAGKATVTAESEQVAFAPSKTANPGISGSPAVDKTLTASPGRWSAFPEVSTSFAWYRCSSPAAAGAEKFAGASGCVPIGGANQSSYTVKEADEGKYIAVLVKVRNSAGSSSATSKSTAKVG